jgi:hypothetical protein
MLTRVRKRKPPALDQGQHVDAVPGAARLHQQDSARAAEIGAGEQRHPFLLGGQRYRAGLRVGERAVDQHPVAGIRHIGELGDVVAAQQIIERILPARRRASARVHRRLPRSLPIRIVANPARTQLSNAAALLPRRLRCLY